MNDTTLPAHASTFRQIAEWWDRFLFKPADPTPLCLMRIVAGLLALYVHVAYTLDLNAFFGVHGWYSQELANRTRRETPHVPPHPDWTLDFLIYEMPDRQPLADTVRGLLLELADAPATKNEPAVLAGEARARLLRLMEYLPVQPGEREEVLRYIRLLPPEPAERDRELDRMINAGPTDQASLPSYFLAQPKAGREQLRNDIPLLLNALPSDPTTALELINYLQSLNGTEWSAFVGFAKTLRGNPPQARATIDYLSYWKVEPRFADLRGYNTYSPFFHIQDPRVLLAVHLLNLLVLVLFTIGLYTRVTSVLAWTVAVSYIQRSQPSLFGQDTMMNMCLLYLMIAPCGATWSVDRLIQRYRNARAGQPTPPGSEVTPTVGANIALRLFQINYCLMYFSAGLAKLKGESWWSGTAPWYCLANAEFAPMPVPWYRDALQLLTMHRPTWEVVMSVSVAFTMAIELGFPYLVWGRLRYVYVAGAILLHTGIALVMGLTVFGLFMFTLLLCWIPPMPIRRFFIGERPGLPRFTLSYDRSRPRAQRYAAVVHAIDVWDQVELKPDTVTTLTRDGAAASVSDLTRALPLAGWLPGSGQVLASLA